MNELITIEESTALVAFSQDGGLNPIIEQVRNEVLNFSHDLSNDARRKKTASLAAKVRKVKTRLDKLGKSLTDGWAEKKKAVDKNRKSMREEMDEIAELARKPLDEWETEQAIIEEAKVQLAMMEDAYKIDCEFNEWRENQKIMDHMDAINDNHEFDRVKAEEAVATKALAEKQEKQRIQHDKEVADKAAADAKLEAEQAARAETERLEKEKLDAINAQKEAEEEAEQQKKAAIQADIDLENEREQNRVNAENAEKLRVAQEVESKRLADEAEKNRLADIEAAKMLADSKAKESARLAKEAEQRRVNEQAQAAELAETNRLAAIEQTKIDEAKKIADKKLADDQVAATRKANTEIATKAKTAIKLSFMDHAGLCESDAINATKALWTGKISKSKVTL